MGPDYINQINEVQKKQYQVRSYYIYGRIIFGAKASLRHASCVYVECKIFIREAGNKTPFSAKYIQTRVRRAPMQVCVTRRFSGLFLAPTGHTLDILPAYTGNTPLNNPGNM